MKSIQKKCSINVSQVKAFQIFVHSLNSWWPREYTWSQEQLQEIKIDAQKNGLCTEIGPHGFRCDWGRVIEISEPNQIVIAWQINPQRIPEPNPDKSSEIKIEFILREEKKTLIKLEHRNFKNHGEGAEAYREAMDSEMGWESILRKFKAVCQS